MFHRNPITFSVSFCLFSAFSHTLFSLLIKSGHRSILFWFGSFKFFQLRFTCFFYLSFTTHFYFFMNSRIFILPFAAVWSTFFDFSIFSFFVSSGLSSHTQCSIHKSPANRLISIPCRFFSFDEWFFLWHLLSSSSTRSCLYLSAFSLHSPNLAVAKRTMFTPNHWRGNR